MPIRPALGFTTVYAPAQRALDSNPLGGYWVWAGGSPVVRRDDPLPWPRAADGSPLAHVLQVDLARQRRNHRSSRFDLTTLPGDGIVQIFHDLTTYGEPEDAEARGWQVRWLPITEVDPKGSFDLQEPPDDLESGRWMDAVSLNTEVFATVPSVLDLPDGFARRDHYDRVQDWLEDYPHHRNLMRRERDNNELSPWQDGYLPSEVVTRMGGYGHVETNPDYVETLQAALPLGPGDEYVLLLELNSAQLDAPVDWFHGLHPLQVWIRRSDLDRRDFSQVWCQIRSDA